MRTKNAKNKFYQDVEATSKRVGVDVFEVICRYAKRDWKSLGFESSVAISPEMQMKAAMEACKYLHPQKRAVELSGSVEPIKIEVVDYTNKK